MKRITVLEEEPATTTFDSLKPLFGSKGKAPYYDPNDLHSHVWKRGKLGIEDNPKVPTYSKNKIVIRDCTYCKICHTVKDMFQSTVGNNKDIVDDSIANPLDTTHTDYTIVPYVIVPQEKINIQTVTNVIKTQSIEVPEKLFHAQEGIFDDYVVIEES